MDLKLCGFYNVEEFKENANNIEKVIIARRDKNDYSIYIRYYHNSTISALTYADDVDVFYLMRHISRCSDVLFTERNFYGAGISYREYERLVEKEYDSVDYDKF